jgi:hypothetical protein
METKNNIMPKSTIIQPTSQGSPEKTVARRGQSKSFIGFSSKEPAREIDAFARKTQSNGNEAPSKITSEPRGFTESTLPKGVKFTHIGIYNR